MTAQALIQHTVLGLEGLAVKPRQAQSNVVNDYLHPDLGSPRTISNVEERRPRGGETPRLTSISLLHVMSGILLFRQICCCQFKPAEVSGGPNFTFMNSGPGREMTNGVLGWANPRTYIYNRDISILKSRMQARPKEGRISSPHIVSTLHLNVMKWKEDVGVFTRYATFLA